MAAQAGDGGHVDDPAPTGFYHRRQRALGAAVDRVEVDVEQAGPQGRVRPGEGRAGRGAGIVDEDLRRPQARLGLAERALHRAVVGNVAAHGLDRHAVRGGEPGARRVEGAPVAAHQGEGSAQPGQRLGDGGTDALAAAGDDGMTAGEGGLGAGRVIA